MAIGPITMASGSGRVVIGNEYHLLVHTGFRVIGLITGRAAGDGIRETGNRVPKFLKKVWRFGRLHEYQIMEYFCYSVGDDKIKRGFWIRLEVEELLNGLRIPSK